VVVKEPMIAGFEPMTSKTRATQNSKVSLDRSRTSFPTSDHRQHVVVHPEAQQHRRHRGQAQRGGLRQDMVSH